jgi:hypothetical protein
MRTALVTLLAVALSGALGAGVLGCGAAPGESPPAASPHAVSLQAGATPAAKLSPPLDVAAVAAATGVAKPENAGNAVKVSFPRKDVEVTVDKMKMPPFLGLTSWAAFSPGRAGVAEAMVMGDLVLFEDEVNPVMSALFDAGVEVTALHNHFFFDSPHVYFMHIGGEGKLAALGGGVKNAMEAVHAIRSKTPVPASTSGFAPPASNAIDGAKLEAVFGMKGQAKDGMWKLVVGHETTASCGCGVGKTMGVTTWAGFAGTDDDAVVDGDFAMSEAELQPVLRELRRGGIQIVALHNHMTGESPRLLFAHYWGRGKAADLAAVLRRALDKTAYEGRKTST